MSLTFPHLIQYKISKKPNLFLLEILDKSSAFFGISIHEKKCLKKIPRKIPKNFETYLDEIRRILISDIVDNFCLRHIVNEKKIFSSKNCRQKTIFSLKHSFSSSRFFSRIFGFSLYFQVFFCSKKMYNNFLTFLSFFSLASFYKKYKKIFWMRVLTPNGRPFFFGPRFFLNPRRGLTPRKKQLGLFSDPVRGAGVKIFCVENFFYKILIIFLTPRWSRWPTQIW